MDEPEAGSLKAYITGQMQEKRQQTVEKLAIPRFNGRVVLRCHTASDREQLAYSYLVEKAGDDQAVSALIEGAAALLLATCEGVETDRGEDLDCKLGISLASYLGPDVCGVPHDDTEAAFGIFGSEMDLVIVAGELQNASGSTNIQIEREIAGNSDATG